jgi:hypothetical protein
VRIRVHNRGASSPTRSAPRDQKVAKLKLVPKPETEEIKVRARPQAAAQASEHLFHKIESVMKMRPKRSRAAPTTDVTASDLTMG